MVFSTDLFLFGFLPLFLVAYWITPNRYRNLTALLGSLVFYAFGAPVFLFVLIGSTAVDYAISHRISGTSESRARRSWLSLSIILNVGTLGYFKYANFFVAEFGSLLEGVGLDTGGWTAVALPIGISFFTFQKISYTVDVYRGTVAPAKNVFDCLLYVSLFPQLIAGPIVRYHDIDRQIQGRTHSSEQFWSGVQRFTIGLAKKVLLANAMASLADPVFDAPLATVPWSYAWLGTVAYTLQIYFDFSGYSDMAIGLGRMMGFEFLENFDRPYIARSFTEFWRRWHISLSRWMREYLYIPLGGNRVSSLCQLRNLWIVFLISGFWHGASWTFILWGAYQGVFLTLERLIKWPWVSRLPSSLLRVAVFFAVMMSWVLFRSETVGDAVAMWERLLFGGGPDAVGSKIWRTVWFDTRDLSFLLMALTVCILPWSAKYCRTEARVLEWLRTPGGTAVAVTGTLMLLAYSLLVLVNSSHNPFIYYRF